LETQFLLSSILAKWCWLQHSKQRQTFFFKRAKSYLYSFL
jgi:hypothetical protein